MKRLLVFVSILLISFTHCSAPDSNGNGASGKEKLGTHLPKVLFITTGINFEEEEKDLPKGIIVAIQTFNSRGIPVRLEPRDVLFNMDLLSQYSIIILSTTIGYHDADRKYSLTYMTDTEMRNLGKFVENGGIIIAGDNVGRNYFDGTDRILESRQLDSDNFPLSKTFGVLMKEKNMRNFSISGNITESLSGEFISSVQNDLWTLVPKEIISEKLEVLASWQNNGDTIPAIIKNRFGKGTAYLLASSNFINPANSGGYWSVSQIQDFYNYVADDYYAMNHIPLSLNPWPNAHEMAFCVTFNAVGGIQNFEYVVEKLNELNIAPTFFVNGIVNDTIKNFLKSSMVEVASTGFNYLNYENLSYSIALNDILRNESMWNSKFKGFRFPYTNPSFTGLMAIDLHNYTFESSISANNLEFLQGSVFPYNIVIANDKFYKSTNILEIAPTYHDDYFFLEKLTDNGYTNPNQVKKDILLYEQYLKDFWEYSVKPYNGLMVYLGHPGLVGFNKNTFSALENLIATVKKDNTWVTSINEVAEYRNKLNKFRFFIEDQTQRYIIYVVGEENALIENLTLNLNNRPLDVQAKKGGIVVKENNQTYSIVFDAFDGQSITITK